MKLQVSFDITDLDKALDIAHKIADFTHIFEIGTILLYAHGIAAAKKFKQKFPQKQILADTKIIDRGKDAVSLLATSNVDWITIMAGTDKNVIHATCTAAHHAEIKVMLDLFDSNAIGQSALEAQKLGADAIVYHQPIDDKENLVFLDQWEMIKGNTKLPIFVSVKAKKENINETLQVKPDGIIIGKTIVDADFPEKEAKFYFDLC